MFYEIITSNFVEINGSAEIKRNDVIVLLSITHVGHTIYKYEVEKNNKKFVLFSAKPLLKKYQPDVIFSLEEEG